MKKILLTIVALAASLLGANAQEYLYIQGQPIPVSEIKSIRQHSEEDTHTLSNLLEADQSIKLFAEALTKTGIMDSLKVYLDPTYTIGADSIDWTNDALVFPTAGEYDNVAYMRKRYKKHTVFAVPDAILKEMYGVSNLEGLKALAKHIYDPVYPPDANVTDLTDRRNSLNRFISYHILPFSAGYYQLTAVDGGTLQANWNRHNIDITDWYETLMPHSMLKCSFPSGDQTGLYINRRGIQSRADERGVFVRGAKVTAPADLTIDNVAPNGIYHYIDDIIAYDKQTQGTVFDDRLRIDCSTLSPDFMNSGARGHYSRNISNAGGRYGTYDYTSNHTNKNTCLGFKAGSAKNFKFNDNETHLHVRTRVPSFWSYQGDEVTIMGQFDVTVKLPPVPAGTYEIRLGTCVDFANRGIVQFYLGSALDNLPPVGLPVDMRKSGEELCEWLSDKIFGYIDEEGIAALDLYMRNMGWMKGPKSYYSATTESGGTQYSCFRDNNRTLRYIIGTFTTDGTTDQYLRMKQLIESYNNSMDFDYIEIVPKTVYDNEEFPEDRW